MTAFLVLNWSANDSTPTQFTRVELRRRPGLLTSVFPQQHMANRQSLGPSMLEVVPVFEATGAIDFGAALHFCQVLLDLGRAQAPHQATSAV